MKVYFMHVMGLNVMSISIRSVYEVAHGCTSATLH